MTPQNMPHLRYKRHKAILRKALYGCQAFLPETSECYSSHYELQRAEPLSSMCTSRVNTPPAHVINCSGKHIDKWKQQVLEMVTPQSESECICTATPVQTLHHTLLPSLRLKQGLTLLSKDFSLSTHSFLQRKRF